MSMSDLYPTRVSIRRVTVLWLVERLREVATALAAIEEELARRQAREVRDVADELERQTMGGKQR